MRLTSKDNFRFRFAFAPTEHIMKKYRPSDSRGPIWQFAVRAVPLAMTMVVFWGIYTGFHNISHNSNQEKAMTSEMIMTEEAIATLAYTAATLAEEAILYEEALAQYEKAVILEPNNEKYVDARDVMLEKLGRK